MLRRGFHAVGGGLDQPGAGDRFSIWGWKSVVGAFTDAFAETMEALLELAAQMFATGATEFIILKRITMTTELRGHG